MSEESSTNTTKPFQSKSVKSRSDTSTIIVFAAENENENEAPENGNVSKDVESMSSPTTSDKAFARSPSGKPRFFISSRSLNQVDQFKPASLESDADKGSSESVKSEPQFGMGLVELRRNVASYRGLTNSFADDSGNKADTLRQLSLAYNKKLDERKIRYHARIMSVRQTAAGSVLFMIFFMVGSVTFFVKTGNLTVVDAVLFFLYSITTAGFGSVKIPQDNSFLLYVIFFVFVGIATLTIVVRICHQFLLTLSFSTAGAHAKASCTILLVLFKVSQVYQFISLEASRAKKAQDKPELVRRGLRMLSASKSLADKSQFPAAQQLNFMKDNNVQRNLVVHWILTCLDVFKSFIRKDELSRALISFLFLFSLLFVGASIVMHLEGWNFATALYFCSYVMTTVGYGDIAPKTQSGKIFTIFYLLFNVSFVSIYMGSLARYYKIFSSANTARIKKNMQAQHASSAPVKAKKVDGEACTSQDCSKSVKSMKDIVQLVLSNITLGPGRCMQLAEDKRGFSTEIFSLRSVWGESSVFQANLARKPSFALLVLVQERFANIIATEVAGKQSGLSVKDTTLSISFESLEDTVAKWMIPAGAQEPFRAAVFEALLYVGENKLVTQGADSILALTPFDVFQIFGPLLAAMADAGTMEGWLGRTEKLASAYFPRTQHIPA